jgi:hypothetical protein
MMKTMAMFVFVLAIGCDASPEMGGFGAPSPENVRGDIDGGALAADAAQSGAGGAAAGAGGHADGAGGAGGARAGSGGATGSGGALAGFGGMTGAGGNGTGGRAVAGPDTPYCADLGYALGFSSCVEQPSPGVFVDDTTADGHACAICPGVPRGVQCWQIGSLCVASCSECAP